MNDVMEFYRNKAMRVAVRSYLTAVFNEEIIAKVYSRENVEHIADANDLVDKAFEQMEMDFAVKNKSKNINEAR